MMNNSSEFSQEEIRAELQRRGAIPADRQGQQFSQEEIRAELQRRGALPEEGFIEKAKSFLGGAAHSLLGQLAPAQEFSQQAFKQSPEAFGMRAPPQVTDIPIGRPDTSAYKLGEITAEWGPLAVGGAGLGIKGATAIGKRLLGKNITAAEDALTSAGKNIFSDLYDNPNFATESLGKENQLLGKVLRNNYLEQKNIGTKLYKDALGDVGDKKIPLPSIGKAKLKEYSFAKDIRDASEGSVGKQTKNTLDKFLNNPTVSTAHDLQSRVGAQISRLRRKPYAERDPDSIDNLEKIRNDIKNTLLKNAGPKYSEATKHWFENVVPYTKDSIINKAVVKRQVSPGLARRLTAEEIDPGAGDSISTIARHMTSEQKEKVLLPYLKNAIDTEGNVNPNALLKSMQGLRAKGLGDFISTESMGYLKNLNDLKSNIERQKMITSRLRAAGKYGLLGLGLERAHHYLY
jgi:hypothetical protein